MGNNIGLNSKQVEAINLPAAKNALILAGAGSGKTLVLTHRYNKLIQADGFRPEEIFSVSFTNKAASEMRRRILAVTNLRYSLPWIGTFHGIANRVLRQHHDLVGLRKNYTILDRSEQMGVLKKLYREKFSTEIEKESLSKTVDIICRFKEQAVRAADVDDYINSQDRASFYLKRYVEIYRVYELYCLEESLVDFSELILSFYELLHKNDPALDHLTHGIRSVLVDEFQDTNDLQFKLVCKLCENGQSIFVVGDDDQLIYSWRGANPENMKNVLQHFDDVAVVRLEQNYRSTQEILSVANSLIQNNSNRMPKKLWSDQKLANNIRLKTSADEHIESSVVHQAVAQWRKKKIPYNEMAILYRKTFLARNLENSLSRAGIPYEIYGGVRFTDREEVRNAMAWLKVCLDPDDDYCVQRAINIPARGIGHATLERIEQHAKKTSLSFYRAAVDLSADATTMTRVRRALKVFVDLVDELNQYRHLHPRILLEKIFAETGLLKHYKAKTSKDIEYSREENLLELLTAADEYIKGRINSGEGLGVDMPKSGIDNEINSKTSGKKASTGKANGKKASTGKTSTRKANGKNQPTLITTAGNGSAEGQSDTDYSALTLDFVANTTLNSIGPEQSNQNVREAVQLMTIHAAKGLEFRCVILCGLEEGILPHLVGGPYGDAENSEEERRLCYVAITRTRESLVLSSVRNRNVRGKYSFSEPSRFIKEMFSEDPGQLEGHYLS